jgi:hypothetical protein
VGLTASFPTGYFNQRTSYVALSISTMKAALTRELFLVISMV